MGDTGQRHDRNINLGLPQELFDKIRDFVYFDAHSNDDPLRLRLVNRSWAESCSILLYSILNIKGDRLSLIDQFAWVLQNPHLTRYIRTCRLKWSIPEHGWEEYLPHEKFENLISAVRDTTLRSWLHSELLSPVDWIKPSAQHSDLEYLSAVGNAHLAVKGCGKASNGTIILAMLALLPSHIRLVLCTYQLYPMNFAACPIPFTRITDVTTYNQSYQLGKNRKQKVVQALSPYTLKSVMTLPNLRMLHILRPQMEDANWGDTTPESIEDITLVNPESGHWHIAVPLEQALRRWLEPVLNLKTFAIHSSWDGKGLYMMNGFLGISDILGPLSTQYHSLEALHIYVSGGSSNNAHIPEGSLHEFQKLESISIAWHNLVDEQPFLTYQKSWKRALPSIKLSDIIPPTVKDLRLHVGFETFDVDQTFGKAGTELLVKFILERIPSKVLRCIDLVFPQRRKGVEHSETITSRWIHHIKKICTSHDIQFRVILVDRNHLSMTSSMPDFAGRNWNYAQALLPAFQKVLWRES